ncbi:RNase adapter RapZ [Streptomyces thermolineatus]|uniref:RNase adapter RapZ n=1 Tax=Streptomyces thermolineatus TaxID=44033 RepID=A0ABN3LJ09_9ACTN
MTAPDNGVHITSFGYGHDAPPAAHLTVDLRVHFRDPHVNPALRHLTAHDPAVRDAVLSTPGIPHLIAALAETVAAYRAGPTPAPITVAIGCAGGRHRAATVATALADRLHGMDIPATVAHRDLHRPVITR